MLKYFKINVIKALRLNGIDASEVFLPETVQKLRDFALVDDDTMQKICELFDCEPEDLSDWTRIKAPI